MKSVKVIDYIVYLLVYDSTTNELNKELSTVRFFKSDEKHLAEEFFNNSIDSFNITGYRLTAELTYSYNS